MGAAAQAALAGHRVVYVDTSNALRGRRLAQVVQVAAQRAQRAQHAADPLKLVEVRRCYGIHSLLAALDELMEQQQAQQQEAQQQQPGEAAAQAQDVQQQQQQAQGQGQGPLLSSAAASTAAAAATTSAAAGQPPPCRRLLLQDLPVRLLVVDSLSALVAPVLGGGQHSRGHALLAAVATTLKAFATRWNTGAGGRRLVGKRGDGGRGVGQ